MQYVEKENGSSLGQERSTDPSLKTRQSYTVEHSVTEIVRSRYTQRDIKVTWYCEILKKNIGAWECRLTNPAIHHLHHLHHLHYLHHLHHLHHLHYLHQQEEDEKSSTQSITIIIIKTSSKGPS